MKKTEKKQCECNEQCTCGCQEEQECTCNGECECEECTCDNVQEDLNNKIKELENELLKSKADNINYRKRKDEEVSRMLKYKDEELVLDMLPIIDTFESAIKMDDNNLTDEVSKFLSGFKMIYGNLLGILEKYEVKTIDGNNKPFDPAYHQAVMTESGDMEPGMVIEVLRKGYILKDKVLRPAMVKVSE